MQLTFYGATDTVTGSRFLVETDRARVLVDCGLFQGIKPLRERNWAPFPVRPSSLDAVVLTHAHLDHSGYVPALVRSGFRGSVYCTTATRELCRILLPDAGYLQEEQAKFLARHGGSRHDPPMPLYTAEEGAACIDRFEAVDRDRPVEVAPGLRVHFTPAGHILGASCAHLDDGHTRLVFSGDVGRPHDPVMRPPRPLERADVLVVETTYGGRHHDTTDPREVLEAVVKRTVARGGVVLVPAFAVGRTQTLLFLLSQLREAGRIPPVPMFLNSPMAIDATELFCAHPDEHRLTEAQCRRLCADVTFTPSVEESKALTARTEPAIIVSASGMATGGRVLHHLARLAPDPRNTILFAGYQAAGTRGEALLAGADELKIFGAYVPVRAEVARVDSLSAHADERELLAWMGQTPEAPRRTFLVHGEPASRDAMRRSVRDHLGWEVTVPDFGERFSL